MRPDRRGAGPELEQRALGRLAGEVFDVVTVEQLEADRMADRLVARLHAGVAARDRVDPEPRLDLIVLGEQSVGVGHEDAPAFVDVDGRDLDDRRALGPGRSVGPLQELDLDRFGHRLRRGRHLVRPVHRLAGQVDHPSASARTPRRGTGGLGCGEQPTLGEIGRVGVPRGLADDDPDPRAPIASGAQLLDLAVIERRRRRAPVLGEHLREIATIS